MEILRSTAIPGSQHDVRTTNPRATASSNYHIKKCARQMTSFLQYKREEGAFDYFILAFELKRPTMSQCIAELSDAPVDYSVDYPADNSPMDTQQEDINALVSGLETGAFLPEADEDHELEQLLEDLSPPETDENFLDALVKSIETEGIEISPVSSLDDLPDPLAQVPDGPDEMTQLFQQPEETKKTKNPRKTKKPRKTRPQPEEPGMFKSLKHRKDWYSDENKNRSKSKRDPHYQKSHMRMSRSKKALRNNVRTSDLKLAAHRRMWKVLFTSHPELMDELNNMSGLPIYFKITEHGMLDDDDIRCKVIGNTAENVPRGQRNSCDFDMSSVDASDFYEPSDSFPIEF